MVMQKRGILVLLGAAAAVFWPGALVFGFPGVMAAYWQEIFRVGSAATGNIMFFLLAGAGAFMYVAGRWQEKVGARLMISLGIVICSLNLLLAAFAGSIAVIYLWAFIHGLSTSFVFAPAAAIVQCWFPTRRGLVSGILNFCFGMSAAVMSPIFFFMLNNMGYLTMNLTLAVVILVVGISASFLTEMPEQAGPVKASGGAGVSLSPSITVRESLRTKNFWLLWFTWALQGSAGIAMVTLSVAFGMAQGLNPAAAVLILTAFNLTSGLSRLLSGYLSDHMGRTLIMSITFLAAGIAYFLLPHTSAMIHILIFASVIGFAFGALLTASIPLISDCFGLTHFGAMYGLVFTAYGFISGLLGSSLSGYLLDLSGGNFIIVFSYLGLLSCASAVLIRLVKHVPAPLSLAGDK
ncbi:MAG TPA: MFS transporter [Firmicutes bacterium]|nr:MFS transporter [Bacillota bacterium]